MGPFDPLSDGFRFKNDFAITVNQANAFVDMRFTPGRCSATACGSPRHPTTHQWAAAEASYDEAIRLGRETGQRAEVAAALAGLAWLEARQGREGACREHAAEAAKRCAELGVGYYA